jgi:hypothetical protein
MATSNGSLAWRLAVTAGVVVSWMGTGSSARGDFITPDGVNEAWTRGVTPGSAYAQWERFRSATGGNTPDVGSFAGGVFPGTSPAWDVFDTSGQSFVTGGGNIYAPAAVTNITVRVPNFGLGAGWTTTVLLQVRTLGTEVDPASVLLDGAAPVSSRELFRETFGGPGGFRVDTLYRFEVAGNADGYSIRFDAASSSMSLDRVAVDTFTVVPAPAAASMLGLWAAAAAGRRRR